MTNESMHAYMYVMNDLLFCILPYVLLTGNYFVMYDDDNILITDVIMIW